MPAQGRSFVTKCVTCQRVKLEIPNLTCAVSYDSRCRLSSIMVIVDLLFIGPITDHSLCPILNHTAAPRALPDGCGLPARPSLWQRDMTTVLRNGKQSFSKASKGRDLVIRSATGVTKSAIVAAASSEDFRQLPVPRTGPFTDRRPTSWRC